MDGVIIASETVWEIYDKQFFTSLLGEEGFFKIKDSLMGTAPEVIYEIACGFGLTVNKTQFITQYDEVAFRVYQDALLTKNINELIEKLTSLNFKIGLVTASRPSWIEKVLPRLKTRSKFDYILSLPEREDLKPKPYPDGYLAAIKKMGSVPEKTIILEDSNRGIQAGKASGALTICLKENLPDGYIAEGADMYVENLQTLMKFLDELKD
jgi:HAD superfamily hydrolase (TIGR01509 family)